MTQQKKMHSNILTLVATAHCEDQYHRCFIQSIQAQTIVDGYKVVVVNNGPSSEMWEACRLSTISYKETEIDTGNWGTSNRQDEIDVCDTEYILQTSVQDYWLPQAMEYIIGTLEKNKPDILIWNSINHLVGPCQVLNSELEWSKVDWGNFCIRTDIAKKVGINHGDAYCADWGFIADVLQSGLVDKNKIMKLPYILTIHN